MKIEGIPGGYKFSRIGVYKAGDRFVSSGGAVCRAVCQGYGIIVEEDKPRDYTSDQLKALVGTVVAFKSTKNYIIVGEYDVSGNRLVIKNMVYTAIELDNYFTKTDGSPLHN